MRWIGIAAIALSSISVLANDWLEGWNFKGDLRLRYEGTDYDSIIDPDTGENIGSKDRNRGRFRLRLSIDKKLSDQFSIGLRLASGVGEPTSTNQSLDDGFSGKEIWIDRVFVSYKFNQGQLNAGKIANPFETSDILWDGDVNPEGIAVSFGDKWFAHTGYFIVEEQSSRNDSQLLAGQFGGRFSRGLAAIGYYHYDDLSDAGLPSAGNTAAASDFHLLDGFFSFKFSDKFSGTAHVVRNIGEDAPDDVDAQDMAYGLTLAYGKAKKPGEWGLTYKYARIEPNAVLGAFADSDFGFADREGHRLGGAYQANKWMSWSAAVFFIEKVTGSNGDFTRLQLDCNLKF